MKQVSTEIKQNVAIFHDGSELWLTDEQFKHVFLAWTDPKTENFVIANNAYRKSAIAKILTLEEYFREYPEKQPEPQPEKFKPTEIMQKPWNIAKSKRALESMIRGFKKANPQSQGALNLLEKMEQKLANYDL